MTNAAITTAFLAIFQVFQPTAYLEAQSNPETAPITEEAIETSPLTCLVNIDQKGQRRDIRVTATAGETAIQDKVLFTLELNGLNSQTMRRGVQIDLEPGASAELASYSITTNGNPELNAQMELADQIVECPVN